MPECSPQQRDHLFISYAWENVALAEWLTFKLTSLGYKVWCDRIKLFGGESFPKEIDSAIKNRTHRLLALLSANSLEKPNPLGERTLALNLARERNINFMIPLNIGLKPTELSWMGSDLTFVDFSWNWADGLSQLLKALVKSEAPCTLKDGRERVAMSVIPAELTSNEPETLHSNLLRIESIPSAIRTFRCRGKPLWKLAEMSKTHWPHHVVNQSVALAFHSPPKDIPSKHAPRPVDANRWRDVHKIEGIRSEHIVSNLIRQSLMAHCLNMGLVQNRSGEWLYFPDGLIEDNRLKMQGCDGKRTWVLSMGEQKYFRPGREAERFKYHLSPDFIVRQDLLGEFTVRLSIRIHITDTTGASLDVRSAQSRRKKVTHDWWNHEWANRHLAIFEFLADGGDTITIGDNQPESLIISAQPVTFTSPMSLVEKEVTRRKTERITLARGGPVDVGGTTNVL